MLTNEIETLAKRLGAELNSRQWRVATAESCTGGWIAQAVTAIAGSSQWFELGLVTYSNQAKERELGVSAGVLAEVGAVSLPVVIAMAKGALQKSGADVAVAVSGIAGPDGGTDDKPVGSVWIAWVTAQGAEHSELYHFDGNRADIRRQTVVEALKGLLEILS
jgi:nicotinamide-nucleotide amidase